MLLDLLIGHRTFKYSNYLLIARNKRWSFKDYGIDSVICNIGKSLFSMIWLAINSMTEVNCRKYSLSSLSAGIVFVLLTAVNLVASRVMLLIFVELLMYVGCVYKRVTEIYFKKWKPEYIVILQIHLLYLSWCNRIKMGCCHDIGHPKYWNVKEILFMLRKFRWQEYIMIKILL